MSKLIARVVLLSLLAWPLPSCSRTDRPPSFVIVLIDTLRYDYLRCYGFDGPVSPALDRIASESVVFERAYAPAPWTKPSIASLFTSLYPTNHGVTNHDGRWWGEGSPEIEKGVLGAEAQTMAELLQAAGYQTAAFVANPWITPEYGFAQGFDHFDAEGFYPPAPLVLEKARQWLAGRDRRRPFLLYIHLMDVHGPYEAPVSSYNAVRNSPSLGTRIRLTREDWREIPEYLRKPQWTQERSALRLQTWRAQYAAEVRHTDTVLGGFLETIREAGDLDEAMLIVTSDHGEELFEHGGWNHGPTLYDEQLRIPLMIRPANGRGESRRHPDPVSLLDVLPTLAELSGSMVPSGIVGHSLGAVLSGEAEEMPRAFLAMATTLGPELVSIRVADYKLILNQVTGDRELYNITIDPGESSDLAPNQPDIAATLEERLRGRLGAIQAVGLFEPATEPPSEETRELLRSLGYTN